MFCSKGTDRSELSVRHRRNQRYICSHWIVSKDCTCNLFCIVRHRSVSKSPTRTKTLDGGSRRHVKTVVCRKGCVDVITSVTSVSDVSLRPS